MLLHTKNMISYLESTARWHRLRFSAAPFCWSWMMVFLALLLTTSEPYESCPIWVLSLNCLADKPFFNCTHFYHLTACFYKFWFSPLLLDLLVTELFSSIWYYWQHSFTTKSCSSFSPVWDPNQGLWKLVRAIACLPESKHSSYSVKSVPKRRERKSMRTGTVSKKELQNRVFHFTDTLWFRPDV